ncbi:MAG: hypothetical protein JWM21_1850 [Acidobacteria bacterium]|nr:hypothetical protein [Acidobacteriota bacterium]
MLSDPKDGDLKNLDPELSLIGFELTDCEVQLESISLKYLRAVHRTALELAIPNRFGLEAGGFWLTNEQIAQLRRLPDYYPPREAAAVAQTIEAYLKAQLRDFYSAALESGDRDH